MFETRTLYRGRRLAVVVALLVSGVFIYIGISTLPRPAGWCLLSLASIGPLYLLLAGPNVSVTVARGYLIVRNPFRQYQVPLTELVDVRSAGIDGVYAVTNSGRLKIVALTPYHAVPAVEIYRQEAQRLQIILAESSSPRSIGEVRVTYRPMSAFGICALAALSSIGFATLVVLGLVTDGSLL
jgi:hypothetical protein